MKTPSQLSTFVTDERRSAIEPDRATAFAEARASETDTLLLLEETLNLSKRKVLAGTVRVSTRTETIQDIGEIALDRSVVDVTHVPVGAVVDTAPGVRTEGDTTIVPVVEERYVLVKQLYLKEELHIRHRVETEVAHVPVALRRQIAVVEHLDADGRPRPDTPSTQP